MKIKGEDRPVWDYSCLLGWVYGTTRTDESGGALIQPPSIGIDSNLWLFGGIMHSKSWLGLVFLCLCGLSVIACQSSGEETHPNDDDDSSEQDDDDEDTSDGDAEEDDSWYERTFTYTEEREPCKDFAETRNLYFGDLHAHSRYSWDAYGYSMRTDLEELYDFAQGAAVELSPLQDGSGSRSAALDRPLDFLGISDHLEYVGEHLLCTDEQSEVYGSDGCMAIREGGQGNVTRFGLRLSQADPTREASICGEDGERCHEAMTRVWQSFQDAANQAYDSTETCTFTTFIGYEYTASTDVVNWHRNIFFRNNIVPDAPVSYFEAKTPEAIWNFMEQQCLDAGTGCDGMVIPHNMNWSNGHSFTPYYRKLSSKDEQREQARRRARLEPLTEIMQHKGDMECKNGFDGLENDPLCDFEKIREADFDDCGDKPGLGSVNGFGCISRLDFVRNIYSYGLKEKRRLGFNPYRFGVIGSTDTHNGTPGLVSERYFPGHVGDVDSTEQLRLGEGTMTHNPRVYNPGGLSAVWAEENSRDALFAAMRRGETYSTSGPRISVRFFGGWDYAQTLCEDKQWLETGYRDGVPMGGTLPASLVSDAAPRFVVKAHADRGTEDNPGTLLQAVQIIKGWIDEGGETHHRVVTVAGDTDNGATVDEVSCEQQGPGEEHLCAVWEDPEFDPDQDAFYYVRVVENPSCRWTAYDCQSYEGEIPEGCLQSDIARVHQERAVTTPIWFDSER